MMNVVQCLHCKKFFFDKGDGTCPFCKKNINNDIDRFKEMFGKDNPFKEMFGE